MKKTLAAAAVLAALALTGCSAGNQPADTTPSAAGASSESEPTALPESDIAKAKQEAIDSGRPANAWDKRCISWEWPSADSDGQAWANKLGKEWLDYHEVDCPDAIVYPYYNVTSFEPRGTGTLVVNFSGDPQWDGDAEEVAREMAEVFANAEDAPKEIVIRYEQNGLEVSNP